MAHRPHVAVIGAGVAGLTTALALAERGARVGIFERSETFLQDACARVAGGMIAPWCERENAEPLVSRLGAEALDYWAARVPGMARRGTLVVAPARDRGELERFAGRTEKFERVGADRIAALEPDIAGRFPAGLFFADEGHLDPRQALPALARRLEERGAPIRFGVDGREQGRGADIVIDCRGLAARDSLPDLRGVRGEMLLLRAPDISLSRPVRLLHPRNPVYIVPRDDHLFMVGATTIESESRGPVTARSAVELLNVAYALHPAFAEAEIVELAADARPAFPDHLPRLRQCGATIFLNGLYRHGFLLAPALARMTADFVLDGIRHPEVFDAADRERRSA